MRTGVVNGAPGPMPYRRIRRPKLMEPIVAIFARDIVSGRLPIGATLPSEPELVERFGVSKVVVRDFIQALVTVGLVRVQQGKRSIVLDESEWDVLSSTVHEAYGAEGTSPTLLTQFYEARLMVEPQAAALSAERSTDSQLLELRQHVVRMRQIADGGGGIADFLHADRKFHDVVAMEVGNVALRAVIRALHAQTASSWTASRIRPADLSTLAQQHTVVADAISNRDPAGAEAAMRDHIMAAHQLELERLDS